MPPGWDRINFALGATLWPISPARSFSVRGGRFEAIRRYFAASSLFVAPLGGRGVVSGGWVAWAYGHRRTLTSLGWQDGGSVLQAIPDMNITYGTRADTSDKCDRRDWCRGLVCAGFPEPQKFKILDFMLLLRFSLLILFSGQGVGASLR